jgi:hypothetical protein
LNGKRRSDGVGAGTGEGVVEEERWTGSGGVRRMMMRNGTGQTRP